MFVIALALGFFYFLLFFIGIAGFFYKEVLICLTIIYFAALIFWKQREISRFFQRLTKIKVKKHKQKKYIFVILLLFLLFLQGIINFIGVLSPELAFDALWYHLTLPKLYLLNHAIFHIPGGLLYYSDMPKLGELYYASALAFGSEITAKFVHFVFGLLCASALYLFSRKYFNPLLSFLAVVIFYSNIVIAWESTTAYIDLIRAFFEIMALWGFINWDQTKKRTWLVTSAFMTGLAIATKLLAVGSLVIFSVMIIWVFLKGDRGNKGKWGDLLTSLFIYWFTALLVSLPWFIFAFVHTGNPVYPFFSGLYPVTPEALSLIGFLRDIWGVFVYAADPVSPVYIIFLPLLVWYFIRKRESKEIGVMRLIGVYSLLAIVIWYFTPRTGGGRFLVAYLPAFSLLCAAVLADILKNVSKSFVFLFWFLVSIIVFTAFITAGYRAAASVKYVPVVLGLQSKEVFLSKNLNFAYADFYDTDGYFKKTIKSTDNVLLYGFHNLYYVDFPYIDNSWIQKGDTFTHVAVQNAQLPSKYKDWQLIYTNAKTMVKLYKPPKGVCDQKCVY